jgi:ABC-type transport system involved in multi-copper enzyme maturation permease subunit
MTRWFNQLRLKEKALPVIARELRAEARRPAIYWLRVLAAGVIITVFAAFTMSTELEASQLGAALFGVLRKGLLFALWIIVPLMTADCVSREKREATLGLLFLTPLTALDVLTGKAAASILRATTLLLASLPMLVLPFVVGGVVWSEVLFAAATVANALLLGIAAGLYASAKGGSAIQVMVMADK